MRPMRPIGCVRKAVQDLAFRHGFALAMPILPFPVFDAPHREHQEPCLRVLLAPSDLRFNEPTAKVASFILIEGQGEDAFGPSPAALIFAEQVPVIDDPIPERAGNARPSAHGPTYASSAICNGHFSGAMLSPGISPGIGAVMNKRTGKTVRLGRSLAIILPRDWTRGMEVEAGDEVDIVYDGEVRVRARAKEAESNE